MKELASIQGQIESIAFGGAGVLRHEGFVVFVPFTAPGDEALVELVRKKKTHGQGRLKTLIKPSSLRVKPGCEYFGVCGGCQLQHLAYDTQLEAKQKFVAEALRRVAKLEAVEVLPTIGAEANWNYRRQIRLHFTQRGSRLFLGYVGEESGRLVEVERCPIFSVEIEEPLQTIRQTLKALALPHGAAGEVAILKANEGRWVLRFRYEGRLPRGAPQVLGDANLHFELEGLRFSYGPFSFVQAHPEQSAKLYRELLRRVLAVQPTRVLDFYCGIGVTTLLLARGGMQVLGVELNPDAIALAKQNAEQNQISGVTWQVADVDAVSDSLLKSHAPQAVVVNPPRTGLSDALKAALLAHLPRDIFYISCMPSTLARDVAALSPAYEVVACQPFDLFPQTTHVETLLHLKKKDGSGC